MELIADALLIAGAAGAALYCRVLAQRLTALQNLDSGLGAAIAALSRQVDGMRASLEAAKSLSGDQTRNISQLTARAEMAAGRLELLLAALHENGRQRPIDLAKARTAKAATRALRDESGDEEPVTPSAPAAVAEVAPAAPPAAVAASSPASEEQDAGPVWPRPPVADRAVAERPAMRWSAAP